MLAAAKAKETAEWFTLTQQCFGENKAAGPECARRTAFSEQTNMRYHGRQAAVLSTMKVISGSCHKIRQLGTQQFVGAFSLKLSFKRICDQCTAVGVLACQQLPVILAASYGTQSKPTYGVTGRQLNGAGANDA